MIELRNRILERRRKVSDLVGSNFLDEGLRVFFHTSIIFVSSNVEGISISWQQVEELVRQYPAFAEMGHSDRAVLQARGQERVLEFIEDFVVKQEPVTIYVIRDMHKTILGDVWPEVAGSYRHEDITLRKTSFVPPRYTQIPQQMYFLDQLLDWKQRDMKEGDAWAVLEFAAQVHYEVIRIHPFRDGNGRVARLAHNLICRYYGLPHIVIPKRTVEPRMWEAIHAADCGELDKLVRLEAEILLESYDKIIDYWTRKLKNNTPSPI